MPHFSERSAKILSDADPRLQNIFNEAIKVTDFSVICSYRNEIDQNIAFAQGNSHLKYPLSKHNHLPSLAVDVYPYPVNFNNINSFFYLAGVVQAIAYKQGVKIVWGGEWSSLKDFPHFEVTI